MDLEAAAAHAWTAGLGCGPRLPAGPGAHLVPGGTRLHGRRVVHLSSLGPSVYVYCPGELRSRAAAILAATAPVPGVSLTWVIT